MSSESLKIHTQHSRAKFFTLENNSLSVFSLSLHWSCATKFFEIYYNTTFYNIVKNLQNHTNILVFPKMKSDTIVTALLQETIT